MELGEQKSKPVDALVDVAVAALDEAVGVEEQRGALVEYVMMITART